MLSRSSVHATWTSCPATATVGVHELCPSSSETISGGEKLRPPSVELARKISEEGRCGSVHTTCTRVVPPSLTASSAGKAPGPSALERVLKLAPPSSERAKKIFTLSPSCWCQTTNSASPSATIFGGHSFDAVGVIFEGAEKVAPPSTERLWNSCP